jgi:hypothetical protein
MEMQRMRDIDPMAMHEEIEKRAYEIYLRRGGGDGRDLDDWFAAEQELAQERSQDSESESYRGGRQEQSQPSLQRLVRSGAAGAR